MNNIFSILNQLKSFKEMIEKSGKDPQQMLQELVTSGKYTKEQVDNARQLAEMVQNLMGGHK